jgi:ABC-type transport system substrate-binding protein
VGIDLNPRYLNFADLIQAVDNRKAPFFSFAWGSDYPDAENNLALFYSPNASPGSNHSNYSNPEYDKLYEQIRTMPAGPERTAIYEQMRDMLIKDAPFCGSLARTRVYLIHPWVKNFKPTEDFYTYFKYLDVDMTHPDRGD